MIGWIAQWGGYAAQNTSVHGIFRMMQTDQTTHTTVGGWLSSTTSEPGIPDSASGLPGYQCYYASNDGAVASDLTIPTQDKYGNSTTGSPTAPYTQNDYKQSSIWTDTDKCNNGHQPGSLSLSASNDACQIGLASWNAADMAGMRIRADTTLKPVIYSMGFQGNGGDDPALMRRLSNINVASNSVYDSSKAQGMYLPIQVPNDIAPAFQYVLSEILRLTL
jgi:hypothetical protein